MVGGKVASGRGVEVHAVAVDAVGVDALWPEGRVDGRDFGGVERCVGRGSAVIEAVLSEDRRGKEKGHEAQSDGLVGRHDGVLMILDTCGSEGG